MSDSVCDVKPAEADGFAMPAVLLDSQRPIVNERINPSSALSGSLSSKRHEAYLLEDDSLSAEATPHACGETAALLGVLSPSIERPKSGLTKTKRNLKKQLHLKMAALDDGRQTPNLPSPNPYPEDARASVASVVMATASAKDSGSVEQTVFHEEKPLEPSSTAECQNVTIKVELPDDDYPCSSQPGISNTKHLKSSFPNRRNTLSDNACPSPADAVSQSGPEVAGPTKWIIGDMLWARVSGHPWWPCMVAYDPAHTAFTRTLKRRQGSLVQYHVRFFGDENERGWINESSIIPFDGLQAFNKFCNEMMTLHKKDRQNYIVPARRVKAWNVAVKSAQEAYPMTRAFRVHHFAFVYNEPVVANGAPTAPEQRLVNTLLTKKGIKRSRSSSVGGSGDSQPKKRPRTSGEKTSLTGGSIQSPLSKMSCTSPGSGAGDQVDRDNSVSCDTVSQHEPGSAVFRSRAEGIKRSSRFVKPTNRIMEHLEEVQQRKRPKLRPHRKLVTQDDNNSAVLTNEIESSEMPANSWKPGRESGNLEENLTSSDEMLQTMCQATCDKDISNAVTSETQPNEKTSELLLLDSVAASSVKEAIETCSHPSAETTLDNTQSTEHTEINFLGKVNQHLLEDIPEKMDTGLDLEKSVEVHSLDKIVSRDSPQNMMMDSPEDIPDKTTNSDSPDGVPTEPAQRVHTNVTVTEVVLKLDKVKVEQSFDQSSNQCEALVNLSPHHPCESHNCESLDHKHKSSGAAAASNSWRDCEPVASTPKAMPNIGESQPSQSAEVREGPIVKKGQKRTFKKKKDSIGSNLQSLRHEETKAEIVEAASEKDSLPAADEQRVPLPMKVFLSAAKPSSSVAAANNSWPDCEPVASTPKAMLSIEEAQPSLDQSAEVGQEPIVKKRQKRTFKKNKDLIGSNIQGLRHESKAEIIEAPQKDMLSADERVHVPMKVLLSSAEPSSSAAAAANTSWPDCEPVASTPKAMPSIEVAQPSLDQSAEVRQEPIVKKRQKRTFKKNKDSIGSNLRSLRHEETNTEIVEAASEKDSLPAADEQRVPFPMKVFLSAAEPSSSGPPPLPPPEKQKKPPGRRKSSVSTAPLVEEDGNAMRSQATETNVTTDGIFSSSPRSSRFRSQPEFQRLSSLAPQKVDKVCHICEQSGDVLIDCQGPCYGSYHLSCLGLVVSPVGSFRCDECSTGNHPCFVCKHTSRDTVPCCTPKCGRFYHRDCIGKFPLCKLDTNSVACPHHTCATCAAESGKNGRAGKGLMYRCIRCPTAYHANDFCIAAGTVLIAGYNIICNSHLLTSKSPKRAVLHVNASWCFVCSKEGSPLVLCSSCPSAFHPACAKIGQVSEPWQCRDCFIGKRPLYGEVVWAKVGNYRWWPGEVLHSKNLPVQILNKVHEPGNFVVRLYGTGFHFWIQQGRVFPFHEGDRLSHEPVYQKMTDIFEKAVSEADEVYRLRLAAREAKTVSERDKNDQKPAYYKHIKVNIPLGNVEIYKVAPGEIPSCHCSLMMENPCGPDSDCINRLMMYECNALVCPAGERCQNQRFQKREDADARPYKTDLRGWGLRSRADIKKGQFITEYVGDLVDPEECNRRQEYAQRNNITNFYMLTLDKNRIIDAGPKGNYSRFMNHSCEPNCETQKWTVNGDIRVGLFALYDIPAGTELMFNYNLDCYGNQKTVCKCGSSICSGFLGVRPKTAAAANVERKSREAKLKKQLKEMKSKDRPDVCYSCKKKGGELIICESPKCLKAYHPRCVKLSNHTDGKFICPWHKCEVCSEDASKLCSVCPRSFCLLHLTSNIFEISDGSLVCSKHQDVLVSCLQDGWNSSAVDIGLNPGANGFPPAKSVGNHSSIVEASSQQKCPKPGRKQTPAGKDNTPAKRRKVKAVTEEESATNNFTQSDLKKRGRPMKNVQNGALEGAPEEQNRVDNTTGSLGDDKLKSAAPTRRSRSSAKAANKDSCPPAKVLTAGRQKNVRGGLWLEEKAKLAAALDMSIHEKNEIPLTSGGRLGTTEDPATTADIEKSKTNGPDNRAVTFGRNTGLGIGAGQEDEFPRLVIDESF